MQKSLNIVFILTIPFCFFCLIYPNDILLFIAGKKYEIASNALRIFSILPLIVGTCNVFGSQFLLPIGEEKVILHATIMGLIISVITNLILIPYFRFNGAAIACFLAEISVFIFIVLKANKKMQMKLDYQLIYQLTISLITSFLITSLLKSILNLSYPLFLHIGIFGISFFTFQFLIFKNSFVNHVLKSILKLKNG